MSTNCAGCSRRSRAWGPAGADLFLREAQRVWPEAAPYLDRKALDGAERLGLPKDPDRLVKLAGNTQPAVLAAAMGVPRASPFERGEAGGARQGGGRRQSPPRSMIV